MSSNSHAPLFGNPPPLAHLTSTTHRSLVIALRETVAPILAINLFRHFTNHSVTHSDNLCNHVDALIAPLQTTPNAINNDELVVLYSACYLHDVGMQYEKAGTTAVIRRLQLSLPWDELPENQKLDILRKHHHEISAELVTLSVRSAQPPLGLLLTEQYHPTQIACLCEAHCVTPTDTRYGELTAHVPHMHMALLSGLLRLADILDETSHRALRVTAQALEMPLLSQFHWWRHYYTRAVVFDPFERVITIHFEFPPGKFEEYNGIIPQLQIPWIEQEFRNHQAVFNKVGLGWTLAHRSGASPHSTIESMPDDVVLEMLKEIRRGALLEHERRRQFALRTFKESRPYVERKLEEVRATKDSLSGAEYVEALMQVAESLWEIGSRQSAWTAAHFEFSKSREQLPLDRRIAIGARLLEMLIEDDKIHVANSWILPTLNECKELAAQNPVRQRFVRLAAKYFLLGCAYQQAVPAYQDALASCEDEPEKERLVAELLEMHLLQGELSQATAMKEEQ